MLWAGGGGLVYRLDPGRPSLRWVLRTEGFAAPRFLDANRLLLNDGPDTVVLDLARDRAIRLDDRPQVFVFDKALLAVGQGVVERIERDTLAVSARVSFALPEEDAEPTGFSWSNEPRLFAKGARAIVGRRLIALDEQRVLGEFGALGMLSEDERRVLALGAVPGRPETQRTHIVDTRSGAIVASFDDNGQGGPIPALDATGRFAAWSDYDTDEALRVRVFVGDATTGRVQVARARHFSWSTSYAQFLSFKGSKLCIALGGKTWSAWGCPFQLDPRGQLSASFDDGYHHDGGDFWAMKPPPPRRLISLYGDYRLDLDAATLLAKDEERALTPSPAELAAARVLR